VTKIDFVYFDAGGGHRAAATALKTVIEQQKRPFNVRLVNLQEVLHSLDIFRKVTGIRLEDIYNKMLAKGWTLGSAQGLVFMQSIVRLYHGSTTRLLSRHWLESKPDVVVSLVPNFNRTMYQGLRAALPSVPYVTILTDFADYPPHFWMERQEQFFICGTAKAVEQARAMGHAEERIFRTSGMILRPSFYQPVTADRAAGRAAIGLDSDKPTGLVLFGGQGSSVMIEIDRLLDETQLIFVCGKNTALADKLRARKSSAKRFIEGFTSEIPYYMHLADFFIGKPGPGSISEAVAMRLPVIVERNLWTLPQERYNADWVLEQGAGLVLPHFGQIEEAAGRLLGSLDEYRANVAKIENRAVFEIIDILCSIKGS
jgi:UDP-N-acetylglucosamine:LPS N-acetylglucosamine transferase